MLRLLPSGHRPSKSENDARTAHPKADPFYCPGFTGIPVRELPESLSRYYRKPCPAITGTRTKDRKAADNLIAQNFSFTSPFGNALDRGAYFAICWPNSEDMNGIDFCHISKAGNRVFVTYEADISGGREFGIRKC
jgi:hypothetical protein